MRIARRSCETTMNLYRQNKGLKRLYLTTALVIVLYIIDVLSGGTVRTMVRNAGSVIWQLGTGLEKVVGRSGFISSRRALEAENASLSGQLASLQEKSAAYQVLQDENKVLRGMLHIASSRSGVTAPVISSFRSSPYGTFLIGAGSSDSVVSGDVVLSAENFVIGRVEETSAHSALVRELFASGVSTDALLGKAGVTVEGHGGGNARATMDRDAIVAVGDPVISPIFGGRVIGVVGAVQEDASRAGKVVYIRLPVNLSVLQFVYLVRE